MAAASQDYERALTFASPQEEALINLMRSAEYLHRAFQQRLKPSGLTATQYNVLRILRGAIPNGLTCTSIGHRMITPEPDITRLLARLKTQKLIRQERDTHDRRVVHTYLAEKGLGILAQLDAVVDQAPRDLLSALTCEEVRELTRLLSKASCCTEKKSDTRAQASLTGKPPSPRSLPSTRPRHPLE